MKDVDRAAVYAAEHVAFDGTDLESPLEFDMIARRIRRVVDGDGWWPGGPVEVRRARADAQSSSTQCVLASGEHPDAVIRLAAPQMTIATGAHELAHALAGAVHRHDAVYRQAYLDVIFVITNLDTTDRRHDLHVDQLTEAFRSARLDVGPREWVRPPRAPGSAFAL